MKSYGYGEIHVARNEKANLQAIIAIHDQRLGPALGGCRFVHYPDEEAAVTDAIRLAHGMTYKAALAGLDHGGGKSVIIRPKGDFDRKALFRAFAEFIEGLGGKYITAEDSGTTPDDMHVMREVTKHAVGADAAHGGSGDPSPFTALGVRRGIEACVKFVRGSDSLEGVHVSVQGVGSVGYNLCRELSQLGAKLTIADVNEERTKVVADEFGAEVCSVDDIISVECDVYAPCALGNANQR